MGNVVINVEVNSMQPEKFDKERAEIAFAYIENHEHLGQWGESYPPEWHRMVQFGIQALQV